jgi:para-nitrobenzyl esterase
VTVFGESAGSIDILHLMASPLTKGLFQRAIAESGAPMQGMPHQAAAESTGVKLATALGIEPGAGALAALRARSASDLEAAAGRLLLAGQFSPQPIVDGWVLADVTGHVFDKGRQLPVPLLIGSNALEMTSLQFYLPRVERTPAGYRHWLDQTVGPAAPRMAEWYPAPSGAEVEGAVLKLVTNSLFTCPSRMAARSVSNAGQSVYLYQFTRVLPGGEKLGAYHAAEIGYVFGNRMAWLPHEAVDDKLSDVMGRYWTQFAATGNPNGSGLPEWPAYTMKTDQHLELGSDVKVGSGLLREPCDVFEQGLRAQWQTGGTR